MAEIKTADRATLAIVLIDNDTKKSLLLPVRPIDDQLTYTDGDQQPQTFTILDVGTVDIPGTETDLDSFSWNSFFPADYDEGICDVKEAQLLTPEQYRNQFSTWKDNGTSLQLVWPWAYLNKTVYVKSFSWQVPTPTGDMFYSVTFREYKKIAPKQVSTSAGEVSTKQTAADRQAVPDPSKPKTYTVKAGDTLTGIATKYNITPWRTALYNPNKSVIGPDPSKLKIGLVLKL
ncbi:LysM peptidoglycan-binding domain-containing protein [Paenibacillus sp. BK720]|uniref:LysM peptidoglycan-binding domain-containing protein n=1 Tax=Paenibacillus sp. BK720 TaxID=2587092 RepID=UPI0014231DC6|nr:LysM peptidoglycan-binding domain-containing protein [Paenibacillus sp. BK720]NIK67939.1 LysM repeat protein [Paenibacillus sp. BK720]